MKLTLFTGNQPRHLALIRSLAEVSDELFVVQETKTSFAGKRNAIHAASPIMENYFKLVMAAELEIFGKTDFSPDNVRTMSLFMGDLSFFELEIFRSALSSDLYVVFGSSYIRGALADFLVENRCINIHMGLSPYYRGSACNFWAMYDRRPEMVGSTIHLLSKGLDSGPILFHALPEPAACDGFSLGMRAVRAAQIGLCSRISDGSVFELSAQPQDKAFEIRYTRSRDFTDAIAEEYMSRLMTPDEICMALLTGDSKRTLKNFIYI
jgi:hypothetical protein